jgi:cytochrome c
MKSVVVSLVSAASLLMVCSAMAADMPILARKNNCVVCHSIDRKIVGPAWMDVSRRYNGATVYIYRGKEYPLLEGLVMKVSRGGSGNWGSVPMPENITVVKKSDIKELVKFVLGLANQN